MTHAMYLALFVSGLLSVYLLVDFINYRQTSFIAGFSIRKLFAILIDYAVHFSFLFGFVIVEGKWMEEMYNGNLPVFLMALLGADIFIVIYYYTVRPWLYKIFPSGKIAREDMSVKLSPSATKKIVVLYIDLPIPNIFALPLTSYVVVGKNFSNAFETKDLNNIIVAEQINAVYQRKHFFLMIAAGFLIGYAGFASFGISKESQLHNYIGVLVGLFLYLGKSIIAAITLRDQYTSDSRTIQIVGKENFIQSLTRYYSLQTIGLARNQVIIINHHLSKRLSQIGKNAA